ncbi:MAG: DUF4430 domain-containing protein [Eubacterium sp.]|nr:DUF4430 domain-containing protein [Eubacterium sp.]
MKQTKKILKRILVSVMCLMLVFTLLPGNALAADTPSGDSGLTLTSLEIGIDSYSKTEPGSSKEVALVHDGSDIKMETNDYISSWTNRVAFVKATASSETATITAKIDDCSAALTSGADSWTKLVYAYPATGYVYGSPLDAGAYNEMTITVSEGDVSKEYKVIIPIEADLEKQSLDWKTNLGAGKYCAKNEEVSFTVEAKYNNRPLEMKDEITYQWYSNTSNSTENGTAISGATTASYTPSTAALGTTYYYAVASCNGKTATSNVAEVTVTDDPAPTSISLVCDWQYAIDDSWSSALGGKKYIATIGDSFYVKAVDENGNVTPVSWKLQLYGGEFDVNTGKYTVTSTGYSYLTATSLYDSSITSGDKVIQVSDYKISTYNQNPKVVLSEDGQTAKKISTSGGVANYTIWSYDMPEGIATLTTDLSKKGSSIYFDALRPGTIDVSYKVDLGDGALQDATTLTITGVAVEDSNATQTKTYLELQNDKTEQLTAYVAEGRSVASWSSANENIATVDENGKVTAVGIGSVIITATDDQGAKGGIKVVVSDDNNPTFENVALNGINTSTFKFNPTTYTYEGIAISRYNTSSLVFTAATLFDTEKLNAVASYTDINGVKQNISVNSGAATTLTDIPFGTSTITVTLTNKTDETKKTVYTFEVTRPRDTTKTIAYSGSITLSSDERELSTNPYNGKTEGSLFRANADGTWNGTTYGVVYNFYNYLAYLQDGLENFKVTVKGYTAYTHLRYSTDDGATWKELNQGGGTTDTITFPTRDGEDNPVVKVLIQVIDDKAYAANEAAGKDGWADVTPTAYTVWVEQLPVVEANILTAEVVGGDFYPAFASDYYTYKIMVENGAEAPTLTYTVTDDATVMVNEVEQVAVDGKYSLTLTKDAQKIVITRKGGSKTYSFTYREKSALDVPDKVIDYLPINSQYTNGAGGGYALAPEGTIGENAESALLSLGNFGGYITYYYENGLTDNANNKYGVDFYIYGNAFKDTSTGTGLGSMEPGQVWVSEDGTNWYALAGSEHYEDDTVWDYSVTYTKTETGLTAWTDNKGNADNGSQVGQWPLSTIYPLNNLLKGESITLNGILLPCVDGSLTGNGQFSSFSSGAKFGYVDTQVNSVIGVDANPYLANDDNDLESSGFDLAWAVDADGNPVDVSGKEFHYVKIVTASNLWAGMANEKSTEVGLVLRTTAQDTAVGKTDAPTGVTITSGSNSKEVAFEEGKQVYEVSLDDMKYASIKVNGTSEDDNIYINNIRVESGDAAHGIKVSGGKTVRVIVQNGEKEPVIYLLKLTSTASTENELIKNVKLNVGGASRQAETIDGETYRATVAYRMDEIKIAPVVEDGITLTINGEEPQESYPLVEGENVFEIVAAKDVQSARILARNSEVVQKVTLIVVREKVPESTGEITVYFTMLGDTDHEDTQDLVHTLEKGNLETWVPQTAYTVESPAVVLDILEKVADEYGYTFINSGNYISDINGLGEFDNGAFSGWMYTLNGVHSDFGVAEQTLEDGDIIVFHYTDDFTIEDYSTAEEVTIEFVQDLINAIGTVTIDSSADIHAARAAYDRLSTEQKKQVTNYAVLTVAEEEYAAIVDGLLENVADIPAVYDTTGDYLEKLAEKYVPTVANTGGEWQVLGLERSGRDVSDTYYDNVVAYVKENINAKGQLHRAKSTDNSRVILGLTAAGYDPTNVAGYNLLEGLTDMDYVKYQGINGPIWALIALDSHNYEIPQAAAGADQVTREKLVDYLLEAQLADNGWTLKGTEADADITAMAIQALAPYYKTNKEVRNAVDAALVKLSNMQNTDGFYTDNNGLVNAESTAQVVVALTALGIDPATDARFVKDGTSVLDALSAFYVAGGGFSHTLGGKLDGMSTEQGYYALVSYARMLAGQTSLYDMSDVTLASTDGEAGTITPGTTPEGSDDTSDTNKKPGATSPKTGDFTGGTPIAPIMMVIILAGAAAAVAYRRRQVMR